MVFTRLPRFSRRVLRLGTVSLSPHAKQKKYSIIVKNLEKQLGLRPMFKSKPSILEPFHGIFGVKFLERVQVMLERIANEVKMWQREMVTTAAPPDEPRLMTDTIAAYRRFGSIGLWRHFSYSLA